MRNLVIFAALTFATLTAPICVAQEDDAAADAASLAEDQRPAPDTAGGPAGTSAPSDPAAAAAAAQVLPVISLKGKDPNDIDPGVLCQSKYAKLSPICNKSAAH